MSNESIRADISRMLAEGVALDNILVNDGSEAWGTDCAVSRDQAEGLIYEWERDGQSTGGMMALLKPAAEWLGKQAEKLTVFVYAECCARAGQVVLGIEDDDEARECGDYVCFEGSREELLAEMDERATWSDAYSRRVAKNVREYLC